MASKIRARAPSPPEARLGIGVTGHRAAHASMQAGKSALESTLSEVFELIETLVQATAPGGATRLHSMLADGVDQLAARSALARGWQVVAPLPFGAALNCAINAQPRTKADAQAVLAGAEPLDAEVSSRAADIRDLLEQAQVFELAERDAEIEALFVAAIESPGSETHASLNATISGRVALAARLIIEQSDMLVAVWDGAQTGHVGGTGHTIQAALNMGAAIIWIDPATPGEWRVLRSQEALLAPGPTPTADERTAQVRELVREALDPETNPAAEVRGAAGKTRIETLSASEWRAHSTPLWHAYRRIEAVFGGDRGAHLFRSLRQTYETPEAIAAASGASVLTAARSAPGADSNFVDRIARSVLPRFAWTDGISSRLSDTYRSGMVINFTLSAFAVVGGIAYLPFASSHAKWAFALFEFVLLSAILLITHLGQTRGWHSRWFETRRAAEYLRHAPLLLALGAARPPGRWPRGAQTTWPEWYARQALREVGLPHVRITTDYLRHCLSELLDRHIQQQRDYHAAKAKRLTSVHRNLDRLSEFLFQVAVAAVALFLALQLGARFHLVDEAFVEGAAKTFTFLGVLLPTFGGAIAGIRYFGDFERFAAISEVTAQKLEAVHGRIAVLLAAPASKLEYQAVAELAHAADDIVVSEIENWQAVFGGKQITVPV